MVSALWRKLVEMPVNQNRTIWEDLAAVKDGRLHIDEFSERAMRQGYTAYGVQRLLAQRFQPEVEAIGTQLEADIAELVRWQL
jgi:hypothetical protein